VTGWVNRSSFPPVWAIHIGVPGFPGVIAALGDEQFLEWLATGRAGKALPVFHVDRRAVFFDKRQTVAVLVDREAAGDVEFGHTGPWTAGCSKPPAGRIRQVQVSSTGHPPMDLRVIDRTDTELSIEIAGEDHTFLNVLKGTLLEMDGVAAATYDMNPEQSGGQTDPVLTIKTEADVDALDALEDGAGRIVEKSEGFREAYRAAV